VVDYCRRVKSLQSTRSHLPVKQTTHRLGSTQWHSRNRMYGLINITIFDVTCKVPLTCVRAAWIREGRMHQSVQARARTCRKSPLTGRIAGTDDNYYHIIHRHCMAAFMCRCAMRRPSVNNFTIDIFTYFANVNNILSKKQSIIQSIH